MRKLDTTEMNSLVLLTAILCVSLRLTAGAQDQGRWVIEVCEFSVVGTADKETPAKILTRKITRLSERVLADCSNLSNDLVNVAKLEIQKRDQFPGFTQMADFWKNDHLVLEIIEGSIEAKTDPIEMWSDVHLFDLKGSLKEATITIPTEMTGPNLGAVEDLHCAVALYALAMDLKLRYHALMDPKMKRSYIKIIGLYLSEIRGYLPPSEANGSLLRKKQEELSKEISAATDTELIWCKEENSKL
jgi:hypothetical protein